MAVHCWKDQLEDAEERFRIGSKEWAAVYDGPGGSCMLPIGHDGPHEFTPDDQVVVDFRETPNDDH